MNDTFIYQDILDFKNFVGGGANLSIEKTSIEPIMRQTLFEHIIPWIGEELWDDFVANYPYGSGAKENLQPFLQRALAFLTLFEYSKIASVQLGENGMFRVESEDFKSLYRYQENGWRDYMKLQGFEALEELIKHLEKNAADHPLWTNSDEYADKVRTLFINHASEFRRAYSTKISRYDFEVMFTIIENLEEVAIAPLLGEAQYDELKNAIKTDTLTAIQKPLVRVIQKSLANFAIKEGIRRELVQLIGDKVVRVERLAEQSSERLSIASLRDTEWKIRYEDEWGNRFISYIKKYLISNLQDFPLYEAHLESIAAAAAAETTEDERLPCGCETTSCSCKTKTENQGIIRL